MAKKKIPEETSAPPASPQRRAAPTKNAVKKQAARMAMPGPGNGGTEPSRAEIAEAAYFRHLNRSGGKGDEFTDWIEAERELRRRHSR